MKSSNRMLALILVLLMAASAPALAVEIDFHDYSQYPLVEDGSVTLSIAVPMHDTYGIPAGEMWWWNWWEYASGVHFDVEQIPQAGLAERKNLILASGTLPDILWGFGFSTSELMRYGDSEELLLDMKSYLTEEVMPNFSSFISAYPQTMSCITTPAGGVYTLPYYRAIFAGYSSDMYINQNWLDENELEVPATLDDFTAMLRLFKEKYEDCIPLGGSMSYTNPIYYIMNAYGFIGQGGSDGEKIALREGTPVIPAAHPVFRDVLSTLRTYYDEGLISPDFVSMDGVSVNAQMVEGKLGVYGQKAYMATPDYEDFSHWTAVKPLTSDRNDTQAWLAAEPIRIGGWVVSADTRYPELICRLADFFYSNIGVMYSKYGPANGSTDTLGMTNGVDYDPDDLISTTYRRMDVELGVYENATEYENKVPSGTLCIGNDAYDLESGMYLANWIRTTIFGYAIDENADLTSKIFNPYHIDNNARISANVNIFPYEVPGFPSIAYFSDEATERMNALRTVIDPYIQSEVAKFITGVRSLDEFDAFQAELEKMGVRELEGYYQEYYAGLE